MRSSFPRLFACSLAFFFLGALLYLLTRRIYLCLYLSLALVFTRIPCQLLLLLLLLPLPLSHCAVSATVCFRFALLSFIVSIVVVVVVAVLGDVSLCVYLSDKLFIVCFCVICLSTVASFISRQKFSFVCCERDSLFFHIVFYSIVLLCRFCCSPFGVAHCSLYLCISHYFAFFKF